MAGDNEETNILKAEIDRLKARLEQVDDEQRRAMRAIMVLAEGITDACERIKNIEVVVFPNIEKDMNDLYEIIGDIIGPAENSLDRRKP